VLEQPTQEKKDAASCRSLIGPNKYEHLSTEMRGRDVQHVANFFGCVLLHAKERRTVQRKHHSLFLVNVKANSLSSWKSKPRVPGELQDSPRTRDESEKRDRVRGLAHAVPTNGYRYSRGRLEHEHRLIIPEDASEVTYRA
jgi:hypothetical protein